MRKIPSLVIIAVFVLVTACFLTYQITFSETDKFWKSKINEMLSSAGPDVSGELGELSETVSENYLYPMEESVLSDGVLEGYVSALPDNFSMYMDVEEYKHYLDFTNNTNNIGVGVNTLYDSSLDGICIVNVYKGSPAESAGIVPGDLITHLGSTSVRDLGYYGVMAELGTGTENSEVNVTVKKRTGVSVSLVLNKSKVNSDRITAEKLKNKIGLIKISGFEQGDYDVFKQKLENLIVSDCEKFIIDVRNNAGGNIEAVSKILDFLLGEGSMFTISDKSGATNTITSDANAVPYPLAVIVNERTVCGAEVFASVLLESGSARLFGVPTYGKASKQSVFKLSGDTAVSLSTTKYAPALGADFDGNGVVPHENVPLSDDALLRFTTLTKEEDAQLQAAIGYLKDKELEGVRD